MKNKTTIIKKGAPESISSRFFLYRWRYVLAIIFMLGLAVNLIVLALIYAPTGLRQAEINQVSNLNLSQLFSSSEVIDFPYKLLQILSIKILGLTILSIKLPSLIISFMIAFGIFWLISRWINRKIAVVTIILLISNSHFVFLAQDGTVNIMLLFWQVVIMILLTKIVQLLPTAHQLKSPKITSNLAILFPLLFTIVGLSLHTPLTFFLLIIILIAMFAHPKLRLYLSNIKFNLILPGIIAFGLTIGPLLLQIIQSPNLLIKLSGANFTSTDWYRPLVNIVDFWSVSPQLFIQPIFTSGALVIILIGFSFLLKQSFSARSLIILLFFSFSLVASVINQDPSVIMILPLTILLGYGLHNLTTSWMSIFPINPYPRFIGILLLTITIGTLVLANIANLLKVYAYTPSIVNQYNQDLIILNQFIKTNNQATLVVNDESEYNFYRHIKNKNLTIIKTNLIDRAKTIIYTKKSFSKFDMVAPSQILTSSASRDFDRFYVYQKTTK
ncbi:MAG: hypothetical protein Q3996_01400 [Candidatus Saccharibacteria bacterium]|nr:hypothetical protein [Candidatus Saccharibacteria bacterium]